MQVLPGSGSRAGWLAYLETKGSGDKTTYYVPSDPESKARSVYSRLIGADRDGWSLPSSVSTPAGMTYALVASRESEDSPVISLAVRTPALPCHSRCLPRKSISREIRVDSR